MLARGLSELQPNALGERDRDAPIQGNPIPEIGRDMHRSRHSASISLPSLSLQY